MFARCWIGILIASCACIAGAAAPPRSADRAREVPDGVLSVLREFCFDCHTGERSRGDLDLAELTRAFDPLEDVDRWTEVLARVQSGEMPPRKSAQPSVAAVEQVGRWLAQAIDEAEAARTSARDPVSFSRLTRAEYRFSILDLLGVDVDVDGPDGLPNDERWHGIERVRSVQSTSRTHVQRALELAERIVDEAFPEEPQLDERGEANALELMELSTDLAQSTDDLSDVRVDLWPGQQVSFLVSLARGGRVGLQLEASGVRSRDGRPAHLVLRRKGDPRVLFECDWVVPESVPDRIEFELTLPAGETELTVRNEVVGPALLPRLERSPRRLFRSLERGRVPWQVPLRTADGEPRQPLLILDRVTWATSPSADPRRDRFALEEEADLGEVERVVQTFAQRAYRRAVTREELDGLTQLATAEIEAGHSSIRALKTALTAVLCSDSFLGLSIGRDDPTALELTDSELAARLSAFLWSSVPDQELASVARSGRLSQPDVLAEQARRMLVDPRSDRFTAEFPRQWLQLDRVGEFPPDTQLFPDYDPYLQRCMVVETRSFFREVLRQNLSIAEFLDSDWTMLNERLARHYAIPGVVGDEFRRVDLLPEHHRGGLLTHASVLSLTSDGARRRPVHRGVWFRETILARAAPEAPANVPPLETDVVAAGTGLRERLEAHRRDPRCASCHAGIDPYGLAWERYDAIGRWRDEGQSAPPDSSGTLPDGRSFRDSREFRTLLSDDVDTFAQAFVERLAAFALRRTISASDRTALRQLIGSTSPAGHRLADVVLAFIEHPLFRRR